MIDLRGKSFVIMGQKGQGKSTLADIVAYSLKSHALYYDTQHEVPAKVPYDVYKPKNRFDVNELAAVMKQVRLIPLYHAILIDEANRFFPPKPKPLNPEATEWVDSCRHFNKGFGCIIRRPTQLHQDITELADYLFIYRLTGKNDVKYLNEIAAGLGDALSELPDFHFLAVGPDKKWTVQPPVKIRKQWAKHGLNLINRA